MPPGINTCITWSNLELSGLLEDEDTRVTFQRAKKHLGLHPFHLNDLNRALREILNATVNSYDTELQGLVLAYKNPKLLSPLGTILYDSYFIHVDIEADFYIFKPEIGCILKGTANKKAESHIGVLVHKAFNVSIPKPDDCDEWLGDYVFVGQEVKFTVTHLDFKGKLPFIRGELIPDGISHATYVNEDAVATSDREDRKEKLSLNNIRQNGVDSESKKKRSKKCNRVIDSSGDEISDRDDKREVFKNQELRSRNDNEIPKEKLKPKISSKKKKLLDSSSEESSEGEQREAKPKETRKQRQVSGSSSESEDETRRKRKAKSLPKVSKKNKNSETGSEPQESLGDKPKAKSLKVEKSTKKKPSQQEDSSDTSIEPEKSLDKKSKIQSLIVEKSAKQKPSKREDSSDTNIEPEKSLDEKPKVRSLNVEKSAKKKRPKVDDSSDIVVDPEEPVDRKPSVDSLNAAKSAKKKSPKNGTAESSSESDEPVDRKPRISGTVKVERPPKNKRKKGGRPENTDQQDTKFVVGRILPADLEDATSPKKRSKKSQIVESENEDATEVEIKPEIREKKKTKSKKHKEEADKSEKGAANASQSDGTFEFIKPEIKPEHKKKRRKNVAEKDESDDASRAHLVENDVANSDFFRDVRIKTEPDPSDVEEAAPREKSAKRKRKHSTIKEEARTRKDTASDEDVPSGNVGIKIEPDASDIEDSKPRKKKSKKRNSDSDFFNNVKIKVEPDASDVEDSKPKSKLKSEPQEYEVNVNKSPRKREKA